MGPDAVRDRILEPSVVEEAFKYSVGVLKRLISIPTVSPEGAHYREAAEYLASEASTLGFNVQLVKVPESYQKANCKHAGANPRYIVYAWKGDGVRVHFNGHYDVVPGGSGWTVTDPFTPKIVDGKLYGRGAIDMKGGIAATLGAVKLLLLSGVKPEGVRLELAFVPDEEIGGECGTGYLVSHVIDRIPEYVLIPEPSGLTSPWHGHKGALWAHVTVKGKNAHASTPWRGVNAFLLASRLALELHGRYTTLLSQRRTKYRILPPEAGSPTVSIGGIAHVPGGGKTNQVPGEFTFSIDRRLIPEETVAQAKTEIEGLLRWLSIENGEIKYTVSYETEMEPAINEPGPLYEALRAAARTVGVEVEEPVVCPGGLDMWYYTTRGSKALSYGPSGETAHEPDEHIDLEELRKLIQIYALTIIDLASRVSA